MKIVDNLYAYVWGGNDNNCNTYAFAGALDKGRHVVIDPGHITTPFYQEPALDILLKNMEADGMAADAIGLVINTHAHADHCEAAMTIREKSQALVAMHEADEINYQMIGGKIDKYLEEGELVLGKDSPLKLNIYHTPGHSPGHVAIYWPARKVLIAGDVIFYRSTGRVDLPGGSARALKQSIERLSQLDIEYLLCGHPYGHPGIIKGRQAVRDNFEFIKRVFF